jgi:hypothetical protein
MTGEIDNAQLTTEKGWHKPAINKRTGTARFHGLTLDNEPFATEMPANKVNDWRFLNHSS